MAEHPIYYRNPNDPKATLLVESESQARLQYMNMPPGHRKSLRIAWGQVEPLRIDGVYEQAD